jgi:preprotein translocase subunit SecG
MTTFVTIIFITVSLVLVVSILLQAGRGGGLSAGLGGASQGVFGGGGGADFMSRLTQAVAGVFMISAIYLAYEGAHTGSEFLKEAGKDVDEEAALDPGEIDWENLVGSALPLPESGTKPASVGAPAPVEVPAPSLEPTDSAAPEALPSDSANGPGVPELGVEHAPEKADAEGTPPADAKPLEEPAAPPTEEAKDGQPKAEEPAKAETEAAGEVVPTAGDPQ